MGKDSKPKEKGGKGGGDKGGKGGDKGGKGGDKILKKYIFLVNIL